MVGLNTTVCRKTVNGKNQPGCEFSGRDLKRHRNPNWFLTLIKIKNRITIKPPRLASRT